MPTFDDLLEEAGSFGRCQRRVFALLSLLPVLFAGVYVGIVFQGFTPDHWCRDSAVVEKRESCGWSLADSRRLTVPSVNSSGSVQYSSCEQYEVDWNSTGLTCDTRDLNLSRVPVTACKVRSVRWILVMPVGASVSAVEILESCVHVNVDAPLCLLGFYSWFKIS